jgi:hypothetical protein
MALVAMLLAAWQVSALELKYTWKAGEVARYAYEDETRIDLRVPGMPVLDALGLGSAVTVRSTFTQKVLTVARDGSADVELTLEKLDLLQDGEQVASILDLPLEARTALAHVDRKGRTTFTRMVSVYLHGDQVYLGVREQRRPGEAARATLAAAGATLAAGAPTTPAAEAGRTPAAGAPTTPAATGPTPPAGAGRTPSATSTTLAAGAGRTPAATGATPAAGAPTTPAATGTDGSSTIDVIALIDPKSGDIIARTDANDVPAALRGVTLGAEDPSVDAFPQELFRMLELPEGDVVPGTFVAIRHPAGPTLVRCTGLEREVVTLNATSGGRVDAREASAIASAMERVAGSSGGVDRPPIARSDLYEAVELNDAAAGVATTAGAPAGSDIPSPAPAAALPVSAGSDIPGPAPAAALPVSAGSDIPSPAPAAALPVSAGRANAVNADVTSRFDARAGRLIEVHGHFQTSMDAMGAQLVTDSRVMLKRVP